MTENKHTHGPWLAAHINTRTINLVPHRIHGFVSQIVCGEDGQMVAHAFGKTADEAEANARLIAAAPEMLEALRIAECGIEELCNGQHPDNECWNNLRTVRAAIAKAEGRS